MRLHQLSLQHWRGIESRTIAFHPRLTVIQGPNESGKSTLCEALRTVLLEKFTPARARPIVPWDRKVEPGAELTFDIGSDRYQVKRIFLRKQAELYRNGRLLAQDGAVQAELERVLGDEAQWIPTLWGTQGVVEVQQDVPPTMRGRLASASQETATPGVTWLGDRLDEGYSTYWTDKRGDPNSHLKAVRNATLVAEKALAEAQAALAAADARAARLAEDTRQVEAWRAQIRQAEQSLQADERVLQQWDAWRQASQVVQARRQQHDAVVRWLKSWNDSAARLDSACQDVDSYQERLRREAPGDPPSRRPVDELRALQAYLQASVDLEAWQELEKLPVLTAADLQKLRTAETGLRGVEASLSAGLLTVEFMPEQRIEVALEIDGEASTAIVETAEEWSVANAFRMVLPGVGTFNVQGANADAADLLARRTALQKEVATLLKKSRAKTVEEAQNQYHRRSTLEAVLGGRRPDREAWERMRTTISNEADLDPVDKAARLSALPAEIAAAEAGWASANAAWQAASTRYQALLAEDPRVQAQALRHTLRNLFETAPAVTPMPAFSDDPLPGVAPWIEAEARLANEVRELETTVIRPPGSELSADSLEAQRRDLEDIRQTVRLRDDEIQQAIGGLKTQGDLFARVVAAEEGLERARQAEARENARADAARLLRDTFRAAREKLQREVVAPLATRVADRLEALTRDRYRAVQFDTDLRLATVKPDAVSALAPVQDLSFGTQEQLLLLTRLCLAELLAENGAPQAVILDDNLVHTDTARMATACQMLQAASEDIQIVVFTCHPERYHFDTRDLLVHELG